MCVIVDVMLVSGSVVILIALLVQRYVTRSYDAIITNAHRLATEVLVLHVL